MDLNTKQEDDLKSIVRACKSVLGDIDAVLKNFESLVVKSSSFKGRTQKAWQRITWDEENVTSLRDHIISNTTFLNTFISSLARSVILLELCDAPSLLLLVKRLSQHMTR